MMKDREISGALFDFLGFLTTREESVAFGMCEDASPACLLLNEWAKKRNLCLDDPNIENWDGRKTQ